jgi:hypothetical protein
VPTTVVFGYSSATWIAHNPDPVPISTNLNVRRKRHTNQGWVWNNWRKNILPKEEFNAVLKVCKSSKLVVIVGKGVGGVFDSMESKSARKNFRFASFLRLHGSDISTRPMIPNPPSCLSIRHCLCRSSLGWSYPVSLETAKLTCIPSTSLTRESLE